MDNNKQATPPPEDETLGDRKPGSCVFADYFKVQFYNATSLCWEDVQIRYKKQDDAEEAFLPGCRCRVMRVTMEGRAPMAGTDSGFANVWARGERITNTANGSEHVVLSASRASVRVICTVRPTQNADDFKMPFVPFDTTTLPGQYGYSRGGKLTPEEMGALMQRIATESDEMKKKNSAGATAKSAKVKRTKKAGKVKAETPAAPAQADSAAPAKVAKVTPYKWHGIAASNVAKVLCEPRFNLKDGDAVAGVLNTLGLKCCKEIVDRLFSCVRRGEYPASTGPKVEVSDADAAELLAACNG